MAIFGSLGKLIGLDGPTGRGFLEGFAGTTAKLVKEDMDRTDDLVQKTAEYKIQRSQAEAERVEKELRENREKIMGIAGKAGGITGAEYLIRTYGLEEAISKADQIEALHGIGQSPEFFTKDENQTTLDDLTRFATSAPAVIKTGEMKDTGLLAGLGLGRDIGAEVQATVDQAAADLGTGRFEKPDLGEMPTAKGLSPADFGTMVDFNDEAHRKLRLALAAKDAGNEELYAKHMSDANKMAAYGRMLDNKDVVSESATRQFGKLITGHIADSAGFQTKYSTAPDGTVTIVSGYESTQDGAKAASKGQELQEVYYQAVNVHRIPYATASRIIHQAVDVNKFPEFQKDPDGNVSLIVGTMPIVSGGFKGGKGVYAQGSTQPPAAPAVNVTPAPANVNQLIDAHNSAKTDSNKRQILRRIYNEYGGSQNVPANILSQIK